MPAVTAAWLASSSSCCPARAHWPVELKDLTSPIRRPWAYRANRARSAGTLPLMTRGALVDWHQLVAGDAAWENLLRTDLIAR